ncbi:hypothetical protein UMM65_03050 [Aureibaculum sp. 2210JD6-5]|uniref:hypothetical protein n=1 Tax=Aureibaculum sp. 2210JD6-5 TaxID=3103957 RepID=UPI002AACDFB1|nr:hypothetical protein [Aureibaculum sp. 2210JD6-5]MDY7394205.1 hypothetical protein [Aureibaculum sp. 2210JD6-5]
MKKIGVWCEHSFQIYSAIPVIQKYLQKSEVILFTKQENVEIAKGIINDDNFIVESLDNYIYKPASIFKEIFEILFISENFSFVYKNEFVRKESLKKRFLRKIFFIKIPAKRINYIFTILNQFFFRKKSIDNYFNLDLIITFTKVYYAHLIPNKTSLSHISIMESWDHPMKFPYYIFPDYCLTWNKDLAEDTKRIQHLSKVGKIKPLKFKYIYDYENQNDTDLLNKITGTDYYNELSTLKDKEIILYPTTTSSAGIMHQGEMLLIDLLCKAFNDSNYYLYIKPKPNAPKGDYDEFKKYKNVIVGIYSNNSTGSDMLDDNYHIFRYLLLKESNHVINAGTTFALEAALMDKNIVQLDMKIDGFLGFDKFCKTYHLNKYILSLPGVFKINEKNYLNLLDEVKTDNNIFSSKLKNWITNW